MRDVRTKGETPLHRAAAYADGETIELLLGSGADRDARDAHGNSPLSWASEHLRPGAILALLAHGPTSISEASRRAITSDHGAGWGNGMKRNLLGECATESGATWPDSLQTAAHSAGGVSVGGALSFCLPR